MEAQLYALKGGGGKNGGGKGNKGGQWSKGITLTLSSTASVTTVKSGDIVSAITGPRTKRWNSSGTAELKDRAKEEKMEERTEEDIKEDIKEELKADGKRSEQAKARDERTDSMRQ